MAGVGGALSIGSLPLATSVSAASGSGSSTERASAGDKASDGKPAALSMATYRGATAATSSPTRRKRDIDSAISAWAGTSEPTKGGGGGGGVAAAAAAASSTSALAGKNDKSSSEASSNSISSGQAFGSGTSASSVGGGGGAASGGTVKGSRMFKLMQRTVSVKDPGSRDAGDGGDASSVDFFADRHLFTGALRTDVVHMLTGFLLDSFPHEHLLSYFSPASCLAWRRSEQLSPVVAELLHFLVLQKDAPLANFEDNFRQMLRSASVSDVSAFFWLYVCSSTEPTVPADLAVRFVTPAALMSRDVISGVLRSVYRRLPPHNAAVFRDIAVFGHTLLHDTDMTHKESLARVFAPALAGRRTLDVDPKQRNAEEIACQWLFMFAPKIVNLDADFWERHQSPLLAANRRPSSRTTPDQGLSESQSKSDISINDRDLS